MAKHNSGWMTAYAWKVEYERKLLVREMRRQDYLSPFDHNSGCACWSCIGRLQASVVQSCLRRNRDGAGGRLADRAGSLDPAVEGHAWPATSQTGEARDADRQ